MWAKLGWRLFRHEARRGELTIILAAIVLSVAAVMSLSLFSARLQSALVERSAQFLAADRALHAAHPVDKRWLEKASQMGIVQAQQWATNSMVFAGDKMKLVDIRAVGQGYPLKGQIKIADKPFSPAYTTKTLPQPGHTWVDQRLLRELQLNIGDKLEIGDSTLVISKVLVDIPDRGFNVFGNGHIAIIALADMAATHLAGPASRISYRYFFNGDASVLNAFYQWLKPKLVKDTQRWYSISDDRSAIGDAVRRAERFFLLASLLAIVLASVSIGVAAQRFSQRHFDPVAIMKTLGASGRMIKQVYIFQIMLITVTGILLGVLFGYVIQAAVALAIADNVPVGSNQWYWQPVGVAVLTGFCCAILFSVYPLLKLFSIAPLRVLRRDMGARLQSRLLQFGGAGGGIFLLMWLYSGNLTMSFILFAAGIGLILILMVVTRLLIMAGHHLGRGKLGAWQLAWARIRRRSMDNAIQLISFSVTLLLLLMVLVMRNDMLGQWQAQLPTDTPNYFLSNITVDQRQPLQQQFEHQQVGLGDLYPMIRGRLAAVNGEKVDQGSDNSTSQGRKGLGREAGLSWFDHLQRGNKIVAGKWFGPASAQPQVSVEQKVAERLDIKLGDKLTFKVGGQVVNAKVTSLRQVDWQTMQPNFFFVFNGAAMASLTPTYITSFHLSDADKGKLADLLSAFPTVSLFDVGARINQLREIIDQVSLAVQFILVLVLCAGALVLVAQVQASMDERMQELTILRTLGAKGRLIRSSVMLEFVIIGLVAGFIAALANDGTLYFLQSRIFDMTFTLHWHYWILSPVLGAFLVGVLGALSSWRLLSFNTAQLLRNLP